MSALIHLAPKQAAVSAFTAQTATAITGDGRAYVIEVYPAGFRWFWLLAEETLQRRRSAPIARGESATREEAEKAAFKALARAAEAEP